MKLVLFGAGKIGRSFIGQLFARSGYEVVFIDINEQIINALNRERQYKVIIKSNLPDEIIWVKNVRGVLATHKEKVVDELTTCDLTAVSVGQKGLESILSLIGEGIKHRYNGIEKKALDIIIAENMRYADEFIRLKLQKYLGEDFPLDDMVGLIETSIGKMVPIMPDEETSNDPLMVFAEPYNTLILDKKGFKNPMPVIDGLCPKDNIKAWVDRKSYIHNFGHVAAAYSGYIYNPDQSYIYNVLSNPAIKRFTIKAMEQSAAILMKKYPGEFTSEDLSLYITDLVDRFENRELKDTVFRVGSDLTRKLHSDDRILSPLIDGLTFGLPVDYIMMVFFFGLCFKESDTNGNLLKGDHDFHQMLAEKGLQYTLKQMLNLDVKELMDVAF